MTRCERIHEYERLLIAAASLPGVKRINTEKRGSK